MNLAEAERWWRRAATDHDQPDAMISLGVLLQQRGGDENLAEAEQWRRRAATDHDHPLAMYNLGVLLQQRGGEGDLAEAKHWFHRARQLGIEGPLAWPRIRRSGMRAQSGRW